LLNVYIVNLPLKSTERIKWRQTRLMSLLQQTKPQVLEEDYLPLRELLAEYHEMFSIEDNERRNKHG